MESGRTLFRKPLQKNERESDIAPASIFSQEEEVPLQASFMDENLDINIEELNEPMKCIHEAKKTTQCPYFSLTINFIKIRKPSRFSLHRCWKFIKFFWSKPL